MNTNTQTNDAESFDLDTLDRSLDDIEDLPSFDVPPMGTYRLLVNAEAKKLPAKDGEPARNVVTLQYEILDTIALADKTEKTPVPGGKFGEMFMLGNEYGEGNMKKSFAIYAEHFGNKNMKYLVGEAVQNLTINGTVKHRYNKKEDPKKETPYAQVVNVVIE